MSPVAARRLERVGQGAVWLLIALLTAALVGVRMGYLYLGPLFELMLGR